MSAPAVAAERCVAVSSLLDADFEEHGCESCGMWTAVRAAHFDDDVVPFLLCEPCAELVEVDG